MEAIPILPIFVRSYTMLDLTGLLPRMISLKNIVTPNGRSRGYVFDYLLTDLDSDTAPFFKYFFTLSSHEPFEIPAQPKFKGTDEVNQYLSSAYYTDSCLGNFFDIAQKKEWYKNTIFILIADHGHRHLGNHPNYAIEKFHIPMLWLGGALSVKPTRMEETVSQIDLASTSPQPAQP